MWVVDVNDVFWTALSVSLPCCRSFWSWERKYGAEVVCLVRTSARMLIICLVGFDSH
jgi:hypothetical protein